LNRASYGLWPRIPGTSPARYAGCAAAFARPGMTFDPLFEPPDIVGPDLAAVAEQILAIEAPQSSR
jgi:hypothetical protein